MTINYKNTIININIITYIITIIILLLTLITPKIAHANPALDELNKQKQENINNIEETDKTIQTLERQINDLQIEIDAITTLINTRTNDMIEAQRAIDNAIKTNYKTTAQTPLLIQLLNSKDINEFNAKIYVHGKYLNKLTLISKEAENIKQELDNLITNVSDKKNIQDNLKNQLYATKTQLKQQQETINNNIKEEQYKQEQEEKAKAITNTSTGNTPNILEPVDTSGWMTGVASAYGGSSDRSTGSVSKSATGARVDDYSIGVAVPMGWNGYRSLLGRSVEIQYGDKRIVAIVNDCGGMSVRKGTPIGGGSRALDLQPGVWKALLPGATSCGDWGLRKVKYRFL